MKNYYLAIDIGASSGRHILFWPEEGMMQMEEVYRFPNGMAEKNGHLCWDYDALFGHILQGMKRCCELGKIPVSLGIDTWGVDFVLMDGEDQIIGDTVGYRDHRTSGMEDVVAKLISPEELYARTGIQKAIYNTIYQLMAVKQNHPEQLRKAETFLMVPDFLHWKLTGMKANEYTEASTSQLLNPQTKQWDWELIDLLGYPRTMFQRVLAPGTILGNLTPEIQKAVGFDCKVVVSATHDTASAILALPTNEPDTAFISSGTWSLMGVELDAPDCGVSSCRINFSNEGGYQKICYLKNIMGLWMIQQVKKELCSAGTDISFAQLCQMASVESIDSIVPCNDHRFLSPISMIAEIQQCCDQTNQTVPHTPGELAAVVYNSLAVCYRDAIRQLESHFGKKISAISIIGGGSNAEYLNQLTADKSGCTVYAGPGEATAIGNAMAQMCSMGDVQNVTQGREMIARSFHIRTFLPSAHSMSR